MRTPELKLKKCSQCGNMVEIFSDEPEVRCLECGAPVYGNTVSCASWCPNADLCIGRQAGKPLERNGRQWLRILHAMD